MTTRETAEEEDGTEDGASIKQLLAECEASVVAQVGSAQQCLCVKHHTNTLEKECGKIREDHPHNLPGVHGAAKD